MIKRIDLSPGQRLSKDEILWYISSMPKTAIRENDDYFQGKNPTITARENDPKYKSAGTPNELIPLPYGRKIVTTVSGYMFKPGYITYSSKNVKYMDAIRGILDFNNETLKTNQLGEQGSIQGTAYELHWLEAAPAKAGVIKTLASILTGKGLPKVAVPRFAKIPADEIVCLYDYGIEPEIVVAIRAYGVSKFMIGSLSFVTTTKIEVYYRDVVQYFEILNMTDQDMASKGELPNYYGMVPVVHYWNNEELLGDFEPVKKMIDAYDILTSDSMNEFDKFAQSYLKLVGMSLDTQDFEKLKVNRVFENLISPESVSFLTKDINTGFITFMSNLIKSEIHKQSHIPDFSDEKFAGNQSGISLKYKLFDFENLAAKKEAYFKRGLVQRFKLITAILDIQRAGLGNPEDIEISFKRNLPVNVAEIADISGKSAGTLSKRTILKMWPSDIVKDVDDEMEQIQKENEDKIDLEKFMTADQAAQDKAAQDKAAQDKVAKDAGNQNKMMDSMPNAKDMNVTN